MVRSVSNLTVLRTLRRDETLRARLSSLSESERRYETLRRYGGESFVFKGLGPLLTRPVDAASAPASSVLRFHNTPNGGH